jgi:hypothetical protein
MFRKYEKTYRILVPQIDLKGKHYLSDADTKKLLRGNVVISEKMDGANVGIIRHKDHFRLQKRGSLVDVGEHYQFNFFKAWTQKNYDKLMQIPENTILYGELMICRHTIYYDMLPDYFLAFAWCDRETGEYYHRLDMEEMCDKIGIYTTPMIAQTSNIYKDELFDLIPNPSTYGHKQAEGLVVWNYKVNMRGKVVLKKFQDSMDKSGHWTRRKIETNKVSDVCHCEGVDHG